jgi:transposase
LKRVPLNNRVYVDESGVNTWFQREYARAMRGTIIEDTKPGIKFERVNIIGAVCNGKHSAIGCYKQSTGSELFEYWFKDFLLPVIPKGSTVIMDNARFHRKKELHKLARGTVRLLFLPPYSPDYNPIEKSWANMKRFLCNNMHLFKSVDSAIHYYFKCYRYLT